MKRKRTLIFKSEGKTQTGLAHNSVPAYLLNVYKLIRVQNGTIPISPAIGQNANLHDIKNIVNNGNRVIIEPIDSIIETQRILNELEKELD